MVAIETGRTHKQLHKATLFFGILLCLLGVALAVMGIWLVFLKSEGTTRFKLFGQEFYSNNVGIAAIFIGAVVIILAFRRILKSLDKISDNYSKSMQELMHSDLTHPDRKDDLMA